MGEDELGSRFILAILSFGLWRRLYGGIYMPSTIFAHGIMQAGDAHFEACDATLRGTRSGRSQIDVTFIHAL